MDIPNGLLIFLLIFLRTLGVAGTAPWLGNSQVPTIWKLGLAFFLAVLVDSTLTAQQLLPGVQTVSMPLFVTLAIQESLVGVALGLTMNVVFAAVEFAGSLLDVQIGLSIASIVTPGIIGPVTLLSNLEYLLFTLWFLAVNGHYAIIMAILQSFRMVPLGTAHLSGPITDVLLRAVSDLFVLGVQMAAPVMLALFITNVSMAVASKAVPQLNVFAVGLPVSLFVGFAVLSGILPDLAVAFEGLVNVLEHQVNDVLHALGG